MPSQTFALAKGGPDEKSNMIVVSATVHALIHADPSCKIDLRTGEMILFGAKLKINVKPTHNN